jgi:GNAT superfamily N-acetyltransferase
MSLYTLSTKNTMPSIKLPAGIRMEECTDISLLAVMGTTTAEDIRKRLANDHVAFAAYINDQPAAFGWMAGSKAKIGELNHEMILPEGNRYLWNFRTLEAFRGLGIYPVLLQFIMQYEAAKAHRFWIIHAPENKASLNGIIKAGFQFVGKLYADKAGNAAIEASNATNACRKLLAYMNIQVSSQQAASCWNCSSPYLKKRTPECCCATSRNECIGNNMLAIAF